MTGRHCPHVAPHEMSAVFQDLLKGWKHAVQERANLVTVVDPQILWTLHIAC